jgi:hypothetical protein
MKKNATRLLYVFSFSLLFAALYLNFIPADKEEISLLKPNAETEQSASSSGNNKAVAQPENSTVLK